MVSQQVQWVSRKKRKKRSRKAQTSRFRIRVRYKYHYYRWISTHDYGSFKEIYEKYKDKGYTYWCADLPPEFSSQDGTWTGYRLDGDKTRSEEHTSELPSPSNLGCRLLLPKNEPSCALIITCLAVTCQWAMPPMFVS